MKDTRNISNISLNWFFKLILVILTVVNTFPYLYTVIFFFLIGFDDQKKKYFYEHLFEQDSSQLFEYNFFFFFLFVERTKKHSLLTK